jgi:hypothetical protein
VRPRPGADARACTSPGNYTEFVVGQLFTRLADAKLGKDIQQNLPRLFAERSAQLLKNDDSEYAQPRAFEHAVARVAAPDLELKFVRGLGGFSIQAGKWEHLDFARGSSEPDWAAVDAFLMENWERIKAAGAPTPL